MSVKLLTEHLLEFLSCTGSSVKMPYCWKSRVAAQLVLGSRQSAVSAKYTSQNAYIAVQTIARFVYNGLTYNVCLVIRLETHYV